MSTFLFNKPTLSSVGQYQMSGRPWLTGGILDTNLPLQGEVNISFPSVTKSFTVINGTSNSIFIHFASRADVNVISGRHYIELSDAGDSFGFDVRSKEVFISMSGSAGTGSFQLHAELTGIDKEEMHTLTGSGITDQ